MKKILLFIFLLSLSLSSYAEIFKLVKTEKLKEDEYFPAAIQKTYKPINSEPIIVNYSYVLDWQGGSDDAYIVTFKIDKNQTNFKDLNQFEIRAFDKTSSFMKKFNIKNMKPIMGCYYAGIARVKIDSIVTILPLVASEYDGKINVKDIINVSSSKLKCD
jgi:hypothetical protein